MPRVLIETRFEYTQEAPASSWTLIHNLNLTNPVVDVWLLEGGIEPYVNSDAHEVTVVDASTVVIDFGTRLVSGIALIT